MGVLEVLVLALGGSIVTLLVGIFYRLGRGAAKFEALGEKLVGVMSRLERLEEIFINGKELKP